MKGDVNTIEVSNSVLQSETHMPEANSHIVKVDTHMIDTSIELLLSLLALLDHHQGLSSAKQYHALCNHLFALANGS